MKVYLCAIALFLSACGGSGDPSTPTAVVQPATIPAATPAAPAASPPVATPAAPPPAVPTPTVSPVPTPSSVATPNMGGFWIAPGPDGETSYLISTAAGEFFMLENQPPQDFTVCPYLFYGTLTDVESTLTGSGYGADADDLTLPDGIVCGGAANLEAFSGTLLTTLTLSASGELNGSIEGNPQPGYAATPSVASLSGSYTLLAGDILTIDTQGNLSETEASSGCTFAGAVSVIDTGAVYRVSVTATGCTSTKTQSWNGVVEVGLLALLANDDGVSQSPVFAGTSFTDNNGARQVRIFQ